MCIRDRSSGSRWKSKSLSSKFLFQGKGIGGLSGTITIWMRFKSTFSTGGNFNTILSVSNNDHSSVLRGTLSWMLPDSRLIYIEASRTAGLVSINLIGINSLAQTTTSVLISTWVFCVISAQIIDSNCASLSLLETKPFYFGFYRFEFVQLHYLSCGKNEIFIYLSEYTWGETSNFRASDVEISEFNWFYGSYLFGASFSIYSLQNPIFSLLFCSTINQG
eukprot:TRINITY_DN21598_c0_g1_i1.p1 TRINITY_DN21598_c0_g1~~TRINITY_DN21598_c0_g1_i1.p1  ORF type:complete len:239 (-),score=18.65 TRINITY_DN21598_c0_g1_i1:117-776(-)